MKKNIVIWSNNLGKCYIAYSFPRDSLAHYHMKDADKSEFGSQEIWLKNYTHTHTHTPNCYLVCLQVANRIDPKSSHHKKKKHFVCVSV